MKSNECAGEESTGTDCGIDARDARALAQYLTVLEDVGRARGAEDLYLVVSQSGKEYLADARDGVCECPDHEYRGVTCKHIRRVKFATGETPIPDGVDVHVDPQLGAHVSASPRVAATDGGSGIIEAPDGGEILDESEESADGPTYTYHTEPPEQGSARYVRCETCGAECIPADPDRLVHCEDCPHAEVRA